MSLPENPVIYQIALRFSPAKFLPGCLSESEYPRLVERILQGAAQQLGKLTEKKEILWALAGGLAKLNLQ